MKHRPRRAVVGMIEIKWQQGRDRLAAVECAHHAESARFRKRQARGAIRLELRWRIHVELLLDVGAGGSDRAVFEGNAAGSSGRGDLKRRRPPIPLRYGGGEQSGWSRR